MGSFQKNHKMDTESFIEKSKSIHGNKYDYSEVEYEKSRKKVKIICPVHGVFEQIPANHIQGQGCPKCSKKFMDTDYFKECSEKIHGGKYDYSKVNYVNSRTLVKIVCPIHGEFFQKPMDHLNGNGCQECGKSKIWDTRGRKTTENFIEDAIKIHGNKYDYSETVYKTNREKVVIICHKKNKHGKEHGRFLQKAGAHLRGNGCPKCRNSYLEMSLRVFFDENGINYEQEKTFPWLRKNKNSPLFLDFYLPDYNVGIECQGVQHFMVLKNNIKKFDEIKNNDNFKKEKCEENNLRLLYFSNEVIAKNYANYYIIFDKNKLLKEIKQC